VFSRRLACYDPVALTSRLLSLPDSEDSCRDQTLNRGSVVLLLCSFLTGFSALLYETVWQRVLGFFSGSDVVSATLVISAYLSGLAAGSFASSYLVDRIRRDRLVLWYAALTLGVGVFAFWSTPLFYGLVYTKLSPLALSLASISAVLFVAVIAALVFMAIYLQRGAQGGVKGSADSLGTQFSTQSNWTSNTFSNSHEAGNTTTSHSNTTYLHTLQ